MPRTPACVFTRCSPGVKPPIKPDWLEFHPWIARKTPKITANGAKMKTAERSASRGLSSLVSR